MHIDLTIDRARRSRAIRRVREKNIIIPTFAQMKDPHQTPDEIKNHLKQISLWEIDPRNLFRITWKNEPVSFGGGFGNVNYIEFPYSLTNVKARIIALVGKWFPTGSHKVGAAFGCLVPRLVSGQFDPTHQKAVWPSTGNFCRGGAYDSALLSCESIAILPEGMSKERFNWLSNIAGEVIATPGSESNVKEIFDKCWELRNSGQDIVIFNQFEEFGNYLWHYEITGHAVAQLLEHLSSSGENYRGIISSTGSAGTIACGDFLKTIYPNSKIVASEALQCPTLIENGFGSHRIEGIGDKHVPWIHNVKNTDMVVAIDDNAVIGLTRLFNEKNGRKLLYQKGVNESILGNLGLVGFSGIANLLASISFAKYYELTENDIVITVLTDSMELYTSRLRELTEYYGKYSEKDAIYDYSRYLLGQSTENLLELTYKDKRRIHNLKYFTWVEQQGRTYDEIMAQWYDPGYWTEIPTYTEKIDQMIEEFNLEVGLI
jgi:cysteine synthase